MKKIINTFILTFLFIFIVFPSNINATSSEYYDINQTLNFESSGLSFSNLSFKDWSNSNYPSIGMGGIVSNKNNYELTYRTTTTLYDTNYNKLTSIDYEQTIPANTTYSYSNLKNPNEILNGHSASEIVYYTFEVIINNEKAVLLDQKASQIYKYYDYVIDEYNIKINVNENNTYDIVETITAYFNTYKHGIYRTIPLKNTITRLDGTTSKNKVNITNLKVDNEYKVSRKNEMYKITIGSSSNTLIGEQKYKIEYNYNIGKDSLKDIDEFYYNIIGNEWDTVIGNISFEINMPKSFDKTKIGFSSGLMGSTDSSKVSYNVDGTKITGKFNGFLQKQEALTIRLELPEGYFVGAHNTIDKTILMYILIPVFLFIISYLLWIKFGKNDDIIETVEFYPPNDLNSAEIGFLYKGKAKNKDIVSLLIYLANKGYIKIIETDKKKMFSKDKEYEIIKVKDYDGNNINEKLFMDGLFKKTIFKKMPVYVGSKLVNNPEEEVIGQREVVTEDNLYNSFYKTMGKILNNMDSKENKQKIFVKSSMKVRLLLLLIIIFTFLYSGVIPIILFNGGLGIFLDILGMVAYGAFLSEDNANWKKIPTTIGLISMLVMTSFILIISKYSLSIDAILIYLIGTISSILIFVLYKKMPKRTEYGKEMLGKIKGFKTFLETVEKDKLESLVNDNPSYFYDILPYTYVLGISDKWIKKFESITLQSPTWYNNNSVFDVTSFGSFITSTMTSATRTMSSSPSSDSSSSSGGGSAGGGSGGGGGGSW